MEAQESPAGQPANISLGIVKQKQQTAAAAAVQLAHHFSSFVCRVVCARSYDSVITRSRGDKHSLTHSFAHSHSDLDLDVSFGVRLLVPDKRIHMYFGCPGLAKPFRSYETYEEKKWFGVHSLLGWFDFSSNCEVMSQLGPIHSTSVLW